MSYIFQPPATQLIASNSKTLSASATTASVGLFSITGTILVTKLFGVVTTVLSSSITAAYFSQYDQTTRTAITLATGTTLSSFPVGSTISKSALAATAVAGTTAAAGIIVEPGAAEATYYSPFIMIQKTGAVQTEIDFTYTTANSPATGAMTFFLEWMALSSGSGISLL
jgi:hypothetical protein